MRQRIVIDVEASETIVDSIKRGPFIVDNDGSGHKIKVGSSIIVPSRKCKVQFQDTTDESTSSECSSPKG